MSRDLATRSPGDWLSLAVDEVGKEITMQPDLEPVIRDLAAATADLRAQFGRVRRDIPVAVEQVLATFARRGRTEHDYEQCALLVADVGGQRRTLLVDYYDDDRDFVIFAVQALVGDPSGSGLTRLEVIDVHDEWKK